MSAFAERQALWARTLVAALAASGAARFVVSPGSRSTPLVLAIAERDDLDVQVCVDERAAAFFALGQSRCSGRPSVLVCTSGTAGAHWMPALIEARQSAVPLIAITADRPPELLANGANQAIDQRGLFGRFVVDDVDLGLPDDDDDAIAALIRKAAQGVAASLGPVRGPVHFNAAFRKPLEPEQWPAATQLEVEVPLVTPAVLRAADVDLQRVAARLRAAVDARSGLIACGPAVRHCPDVAVQVERLADQTGFALFVETASGCRWGRPPGPNRVDAFESMFATAEARAALAPRAVIQVGRAPVSATFGRLLREHPPETHVVIGPDGWHDPTNRADVFLRADLLEAVSGLRARIGGAARSNPWAALSREVFEAGAETLDDALSEPSAVRATFRALEHPAHVVVGNSLTIRDVDTYVDGATAQISISSQRGASGIDGAIAAAGGTSSVSPLPVVALMGDVTFLHDVGSLQLLPGVRRPLVLVVIDNGGGRIFERLPVAAHGSELLERYFMTSHEVPLTQLCAPWGVASATCTSATELRDAVAAAVATPHATVVHARIDIEASARHRDAWRAASDRLVRAHLADRGAP